MLKSIKYLIVYIFCLVSLQAAEPVTFQSSNMGEFTGNTQRLVQNVVMRQGRVVATCNEALRFIDLNKSELRGNVVIKQGTITIKAPVVYYDANTGIATAEGGVTLVDKTTKLTAKRGVYDTRTYVANFHDEAYIEDDSVLIYCNHLTHDRRTANSIAWGDVAILGRFTNVILVGDSVFNVPSERYSKAVGNPKLFQIDTTDRIRQKDNTIKFKFDTLSIRSNVMEAFREPNNERYVFTDSLRIIRQNFSSSAKSGVYYKDKEFISLWNGPIVWYDSTQLYADSIAIFTPKQKLNRLNAIRNAISISCNDSTNWDRKDQMVGSEINIIFERDSVKYIVSKGDAKSLYFMLSDGLPDGLLRASADTITILVNAGKAEKVIMRNKAPGDYQPQPAVEGKVKEFYFPGFKWSYDRPKKIPIIIPRIDEKMK